MACLPLYYMWKLDFHKLCAFVAVSWWLIFGFYYEVFDLVVWVACEVAIGSALLGMLIMVFAPLGCPPWESEQ